MFLNFFHRYQRGIRDLGEEDQITCEFFNDHNVEKISEFEDSY